MFINMTFFLEILVILRKKNNNKNKTKKLYFSFKMCALNYKHFAFYFGKQLYFTSFI